MIPKILYKFFSPNAVCHTIGKGHIRFSRADLVNDPFEFLPRYDALAADIDPNEESIWSQVVPQDELVEIRSSPEYQQKMDEVKSDAELSAALKNQKMFADRFGFLSFCEQVSSPVMWGHYCKDHTGFVISFNTKHDFFKTPNHLIGMTYENERPQFHEPNLQADKEKIRAERLLSVKNEEWGYEREWRLYTNFNHAGQQSDYKFHPFPFEAVTGIYFGLRCVPSFIKSVTDEFQTRGTIPPRFKMKPHRTKFELEPTPL